MPLHTQDCQASENLPPLSQQQTDQLLSQLNNWELTNSPSLVKCFRFDSYPKVIEFVNAVAGIAEKQNHHPEMLVEYQQCQVSYQTHSRQCLTLNDFICAAKIDQLRLIQQ